MTKHKPRPKPLRPKKIEPLSEVLPPIGHGRVNGYPELIRRRILELSDPVGFAIRVMQGAEEFTAKIGGKKVRFTPTLDQRIECMKWLGNKILPDLKSMDLNLAPPQDPNEEYLNMSDSQRMREIKRNLAVLGITAAAESDETE